MRLAVSPLPGGNLTLVVQTDVEPQALSSAIVML
jgi:hypothetical protein